MKNKLGMAGAMLVGFILPATAQVPPPGWYIVQDMKTKHCQIVDQKPMTKETTIVGENGVVYQTRVEAENAMKTVKVCTTD